GAAAIGGASGGCAVAGRTKKVRTSVASRATARMRSPRGGVGEGVRLAPPGDHRPDGARDRPRGPARSEGPAQRDEVVDVVLLEVSARLAVVPVLDADLEEKVDLGVHEDLPRRLVLEAELPEVVEAREVRRPGRHPLPLRDLVAEVEPD